MPTASDGHVTTFDASSPDCTVNVTGACQSLDFTGFANVLTMTSAISCTSGTITFQANQASRIAGAGLLTLANTTTIIANGATWNNALTFSVTSTKTVTGTLTVTGLFTSGSSTTQTVNGGTLVLNGGMTINGTTTGTTNVTLAGGTWSGASALQNNLTFAGNVTVSGSVAYNTGTITRLSGTITTTGSTLTVASISATFDTNSTTWNNLSFTGTGVTHTLISDLTLTGTLSVQSTNGTTLTFNGFTLYIGGNFTQSTTSAIITGTTEFVYNGTGTWSSATTQQLRSNLTINTAGTLTISGNVNYNSGVFAYVAGTVITTGSTITVASTSATTFNTAGIVFDNMIFNFAATITINSLLSATGTVSLTLNTTFAGSAGWTFGTVSVTTADHVLKSGLTYTITTNLTVTGTAANNGSFTSSIGGSQAILTLQQGATQDIDFCSATDIDSRLGLTIAPYKATTLSNASNWRQMPTQQVSVGRMG